MSFSKSRSRLFQCEDLVYGLTRGIFFPPSFLRRLSPANCHVIHIFYDDECPRAILQAEVFVVPARRRQSRISRSGLYLWYIVSLVLGKICQGVH